MITREDVAALRVGDVVEVAVPAYDKDVLVIVRGPLKSWLRDHLVINTWQIRNSDGEPSAVVAKGTLTVISRAKPPLYVNSDKTEPDPGDVVRDADGGIPDSWHWLPAWNAWADRFGKRVDSLAGRRLRLLVDGRTGQVVP